MDLPWIYDLLLWYYTTWRSYNVRLFMLYILDVHFLITLFSFSFYNKKKKKISLQMLCSNTTIETNNVDKKTYFVRICLSNEK